MVFVTVNCAPIATGGMVESIQVTGGVKWNVDCKVNPTAFVDQERMSSLLLGLAFKCGSSGTPPMSATCDESRRNGRHLALRRDGHRRLVVWSTQQHRAGRLGLSGGGTASKRSISRLEITPDQLH